MGTPKHYSRELPERCLQLIEELWPAVEKVRVRGEERLGPLTTTFLLAMATPIITLPLERIERHFSRGAGGYMDDRPLDEELAGELRSVFNAPRLEVAPFFTPGCWRFATMPYLGENLAQHFPFDIAERLGAADALDAAAKMPVGQWASCLRNALAHGGVLYLDHEGFQSHGSKAEELAFVSAKYPDGNLHQPPERLNVLRIGELEFRSFLDRWVHWLSASGLSQALAA